MKPTNPFSARWRHPVYRFKDPSDGDEARDQTHESGDGTRHGEEAEGVRGDGGVAGVDHQVAEDALVMAEDLGRSLEVTGGFGLGED